MVEKSPQPEMMMPRMVERPLWPIQVRPQCPKCCKDLVCEPAPVPAVIEPNTPAPPQMFVLTCITDGCGYTFICPTQMPIVDFRSERPAAWEEVLGIGSGHRCGSCRVVMKKGAKRHKWPDKSSTCETCGGPDPIPE